MAKTIQERVFDALRRDGGSMHLNDMCLRTGLDRTQVQGALYHLKAYAGVARSDGDGFWTATADHYKSKTTGGFRPKKKDPEPAPVSPNGETEAGDLFEMVGKTADGRAVVRSVDNQVIYTISPINA